MSTVFSRYHQPTGLECFDLAVQIEVEIYKVIRKFPKSVRFTHAIPLYELAQRMNDYVVYANSIYPTNEREVEVRKDMAQRAIGCNEAIIQRLKRCAYELESVDINSFDRVGEMLIKASTLLRAW